MRHESAKSPASPVRAPERVGVVTERVAEAVRHVLVAAGDPSALETRERQLLAAGFRVTVARTSFETIVKASCQMPDLILLDPSLGKADVMDTSELLATCPVTAHIPVVRLTLRRGVPRRILTNAAASSLQVSQR